MEEWLPLPFLYGAIAQGWELSSLNRIYNLVIRKKKKENHEIVFYLQANKVDSALMLLDVYRDKIHYDAKQKEWIVVR